MAKQTFESVYREQIAELCDAEQQMIENMPSMLRAASSQELKSAFEIHLAETKEQLTRLEIILADMPAPRPRNLSDPMRALLAKSRLVTIRHEGSPASDAALIAVAQQIEYHEISAYSSARMLARMLGHERAAMLLGKSMQQEQDTAGDLAEIAEVVIMGEELEDAVLEEPVPA